MLIVLLRVAKKHSGSVNVNCFTSCGKDHDDCNREQDLQVRGKRALKMVNEKELHASNSYRRTISQHTWP